MNDVFANEQWTMTGYQLEAEAHQSWDNFYTDSSQ